MAVVLIYAEYITELVWPVPTAQTRSTTRVSGWKKHMASKHATAPWYGASETTQASLILQSVQEEIAAPTAATQEVEFRLPTQEEISTVPLKPTVVEKPPEESLPYTVECGGGRQSGY